MINTPLLPFFAALVVGALTGLAFSASKRLRRGCVALLSLVVIAAFIGRGMAILSTEPTFGFDLAWVYNAAWNLAEGRGPWSDLLGTSMYGVHGFFLFPLFLPFYWLIPHIAGFYVAQFCWGLVAVIPAFMFGRRLFDCVECGIMVSLLYLLHPAISGFVLTESQPTIIGVPFLFLYMYAKVAQRPCLMVLAAAVAAMAFEVFALAIISAGAVEAIRRRKYDSADGAVALAGLLALLLFVMARPETGWISGGRHYAAFGGSPAGAVSTLFREPHIFSQVVFTRTKLGYLAHLFLPVCLLPLMAPLTLVMALPEMVLVLLADPSGDMPKINSFYTHVATVAILCGACQVISNWRERLRPVRALFILLLVATLLQFNYHHTFVPKLGVSWSGALNFAANGPFKTISPTVVPEGSTMTVLDPRLAWRFPRRRVVVVHNWLSPHRAHQFAEHGIETDYLVLARGEPAPDTGAWITWDRDSSVDIYRRK